MAGLYSRKKKKEKKKVIQNISGLEQFGKIVLYSNKIDHSFTLSLAVYSPLPPNKPNPPSKISVSAIKRIASMEWPEYPHPPPWPFGKDYKYYRY